jgi:hypothetical protein
MISDRMGNGFFGELEIGNWNRMSVHSLHSLGGGTSHNKSQQLIHRKTQGLCQPSILLTAIPPINHHKATGGHLYGWIRASASGVVF